MALPMRKGMGVLALTVLFLFIFGCGGQKSSGQQEEVQQPQKPAATTTQPVASVHKGDPVKGKTYFLQFCSSCHGQNALGLKGLGKDLVHSQFVAQKTDEQLLEYVKKGRPVNDPLNTTGVPMPPKGGNPALTDEQILDIIAYLRTIHQ